MAKSSKGVENKDIYYLIFRFLLKNDLIKTAKRLLKETKCEMDHPVR